MGTEITSQNHCILLQTHDLQAASSHKARTQGVLSANVVFEIAEGQQNLCNVWSQGLLTEHAWCLLKAKLQI